MTDKNNSFTLRSGVNYNRENLDNVKTVREHQGPPPPPRTRTSSISSRRSVRSRRTTIEIDAGKKLAIIEDDLSEKEAELENAKAELSAVRKRIAKLKENTDGLTPGEYVDRGNQLVNEEIEAEKVVSKLEIALNLEKAKASRKKDIILQEKKADLEDVDSEEEDDAQDLNREEDMHAGRTEDWVKEQQCEPGVREETHVEPPKEKEEQATGSGGELTLHQLVDALNTYGNSRAPVRNYSRGTCDMELPKFGGEPERWIQFKEEYERTTNKFQLDDSENMLRLRKALIGQAKQTVQHLMANVRNTPTIISTLEKRFGRPRMVLNALAARARTCGNVTLSKPESIIEMGLAVQALVSNVLSFDEAGYLQNVELLDILVKKLSPDLATRWFEWLAINHWRNEDLASFCDWISIQLDIAYQRVDVKTEDFSEERRDKKREKKGGQINTTVTDDPKCLCCGKKKHTIDQCFTFKKKTVDERWKLAKTVKPRICFCCFKEGHSSSECTSTCSVDGCGGKHHQLLHNTKPKESDQFEAAGEPGEMVLSQQTVLQGSIAIVKGCDGPLPIVPVKFLGTSGTVRGHALLDTGASRSIMTKAFAERLGITGRRVTYCYKGVTGNAVIDPKASIINCKASGTSRGDKFFNMSGVVTVSELRMNPYSFDMDEVKRRWPYLRQVAAPGLTNVVPDVIVGNNNPHLILARKLIVGNEDEPIGWRSNLGWTVAGDFENKGSGSMSLCYGITDSELHEVVKQSFSFEDLGVKIPKNNAKNLDEKRSYEILEKTTRKVDGAWETGLLWRSDEVSFPNTEAAALKRLLSVERQMKDPVFAAAYRNKMAEYLEKGYMRKLPEVERNTTTPRTNVIAHFGHVNPNKPGKFRFILDAKAMTNGVSLNSQLLKGPDLIQPLVAVLWNFRAHRIALTGDITDMFHRVKIRKEDQDSQRLLWRDGDSSRKPDHYVMTAMIFGATCSPASAIYVKNKNAESFRDVYPNAANVTVTSFYVDDVLCGGETEEEVAGLRQELSEIHEAGNFKICKWMSNSKRVLSTIPVDLRAEGAKDFEDKDIPGERVLGLWWDATSDTFGFKLGLHRVKESILKGAIPTKRQMCGLVMSLYDPLGFLAHYKIKGLMLLQEVWRDGTGWDDEIQMGTFEKWRVWLSRLPEINKVQIPRCYSEHLKTADSIQLHVFSDASSEALSAVCYLRIQKGGNVNVAFVNAKARVSPLKKTTIPRMELQAALLGCRLATTIQEQLRVKLDKVLFWVDSTTVLFWIRSRAGKLKEFVANRIGEIQELTNPEQWHWVPTKLNVADQATRYESEISFSPDCQWYRGPPFLYGTEETWSFEEDRAKDRISDEGIVAAVKGDLKFSSTLRITTPDPDNFSMYNRLVRATAAVHVAARHWLSLVRNQSLSFGPWKVKTERKPVISPLLPADIYFAEKKLLKLAQEESFDVEKISKGKDDKLWRLSPVVGDDGLVRVGSRIQAAEGIEFETRSPIILPSRHRVVSLLIGFEHEKNAHQGVETVLANLRKKFWLIDGRHTVTRAFRNCELCRLRRMKPVTPQMGQIPSLRLEAHQPPFHSTGVDLFGPLEVTVGRRHEKRWGVLFCCMVVRAVHLEVVHALSTDEFMMALSRFIDTRGRPQIIASDNGTNFVGAARVLNEKWGDIDLQKVIQDSRFQKIGWEFNPPLAPHMGGAWERLIQIVKKCLVHILKDKFPRDTTLLTALKGAENMLNSRPLTHQSRDATDPVAITPNHLLRGSCHSGPSIPATTEASDMSLRDMWSRAQVLQDQFWEHWNRHYLPKLLIREKWHQKNPSLEVGDVVSLVDEQLKSNFWRRGVITQVFPGADGEVRVVEVTVRDFGQKKPSIYRRAATRVCPLGLRMEIKDRSVP